ncbi:hypothetical protein A1359_13305 [Methylomonas lenta]|uniref:Uncharacterized protein n=1 Tax=Methylomonas lenta TaxID=980561 RepID=A0A177N463_9GAMM|nr:hypothetical protein A1359_13305 [Methylomonas lenta]
MSVNFASIQTCLLPEYQKVKAIHAEMILFNSDKLPLQSVACNKPSTIYCYFDDLIKYYIDIPTYQPRMNPS